MVDIVSCAKKYDAIAATTNSNTNTIYEFNGNYWHGNPSKFNLDDVNQVTKTTFRYLYDKLSERESL
ncbi:MAG: hypothetical protein V4440_14075, partial [Pseudomonadota bacterium]